MHTGRARRVCSASHQAQSVPPVAGALDLSRRRLQGLQFLQGATRTALRFAGSLACGLLLGIASAHSASSDFDTLAAAPNVVRALRGNEPGFINNDPDVYWLSEGSIPGSLTRPVYDPLVGGLRFDIVPVKELPPGDPGDWADIAGAFYFNFGKRFGPKQKFRVRWQQMFNGAMVRTRLLSDTAIKQAIIGSGDAPGVPPQASCTEPDIVVQTYEQFRFAHVYHSCGRYWGLYGEPNFAFQNQVPAGGPYCNYDATTEQAASTGDVITPPSACIGWPIMQWQDYAIEVENGDIVPGTGQYAYSVVRLYIGLNPDASLHLAHEWDSRNAPPTFEWNGLGLFVGDESTGESFFGKFWGTPYMTGYRGGHTETLQTWYRHFIVTDETVPVQTTPPPVNSPIANLPENGAVDLGPYQWTDTGGHVNGYLITDYSGMVYAPSLRAMLVFGGGHASTDYDGVNSFSLMSLQWKELYLPTPGSFMTPQNYDSVRGAWSQGPANPRPRPAARHTLDEMAVVGDELIVLAEVEGNGSTAGANWPEGYTSFNTATAARVAHLNLQTLQWSFAPDDFGAVEWSAVEYDPPSGKVILLGDDGLFVYDPVTKRKTVAVDFLDYAGLQHLVDERGNSLPSEALAYNQNLVYYPPNGKHYYIVSNTTPEYLTGSVFEVDLNRQQFDQSIVRRIADAPAVGDTKFAYDSKNRLIGGGLSNGVFYAFDPIARSWSTKTVKGPRSIAFMAMDYDPQLNAYIMITPEGNTWAYRWQ
jgi:hypothetical protein